MLERLELPLQLFLLSFGSFNLGALCFKALLSCTSLLGLACGHLLALLLFFLLDLALPDALLEGHTPGFGFLALLLQLPLLACSVVPRTCQ